MKKEMSNERRNFLKMSVAGAAGLALSNADKVFGSTNTSGAVTINPAIDNMRVVACHDELMWTVPISGVYKGMIPTSFDTINAQTNSGRVQANMDAMAMQLANKTTASEAWSAIFRSSKPWATTKVAIKINGIEPLNMARTAVVDKFCKVLAGMGVLPANIIVYDGNALNSKWFTTYSKYFSLTDTTKIKAVVSNVNASLGGTVNAPVPSFGVQACTADIANGNIDILINLANNKGHDYMGKATLSMKNHFGTFTPNNHTGGDPYIMNISKSNAIVGGNPPRQQLCFIDSLLANKIKNVGQPDAYPNYLIMGVFGPAVDYCTVKKVRETVMGCTHTSTIIDSYLTTFGYATTDPVWVDVPPVTGIVNPGSHQNSGQALQSFEVAFSNGKNKTASAHFSIPQSATSLEVKIIDMKGRIVREFNVPSLAARKITWNGMSSSGRIVSAGEYAIKVSAGSYEQTGRIIVG